MKNINKLTIGMLTVISLLLGSCGTTGSSTGGSYRSVNNYHHGAGAWGTPYYGDEVIIIDDGYDLGMPDAVTLPMDDWD